MAYFFRLILRRIAYIIAGSIVGFFVTFCHQAKADYTVTTFEYGRYNNASYHPSFTAACQAEFVAGPVGKNAGYYYVSIDASTAEPICRMNVFQGSNYQVASTLQKFKTCNGVRQAWTAGQGAGVCSGSLICTAPQVPNSAGNACVAPPSPCENKTLSSTTSRVVNSSTGTAPNSVCIANCTYNVNFKNIVICAGNKCSLSVVSPSTGQQCASAPVPTTGESETPPEKTPEEKCIASGQSYGTINGTVVCAKAGTPSTPPVNVTDNKTTTNAAGTGNTTTTTTINNNTVTTTTTTTPANGGDPITETTEQDFSGFCEENPTSKICKDAEESTFGGACAGGFICEGDAIQCATAKRIQQNKCDYEIEKQTLETKTAYTTGNKLLNGEYDSDVQAFINKEGDSVRQVNIQQLSESGAASFSGEGIQDVSFTVMSRAVTIPLSNTNQYLEYMGYILLALSYFAAFKIVSGAV